MTEQNLRHQLRNQLNNIAMNAELAKLQLRKQASVEEIIATLDKVTESCRAAGTALDQEKTTKTL